jgi:hypothetical protein
VSGWWLSDGNSRKVTAKLAGPSIAQGRREEMTIDGIVVGDLFAAYRTGKAAQGKRAMRRLALLSALPSDNAAAFAPP